MFISKQDRLENRIREWADQYGRDRSGLLPILQEIQKKYSYVSKHAMQVVANELDIHPVEVYGVVTFYAFLSDKPRGKFVIRLCRTISCDMVGRDRVARQLENDLGITFGETTEDKKFSLEWASCLGMCDQGPALLVNDTVYTKITPQSVHEILDECRRTFASHAPQREAKVV
jgi:[NiFe] hydrogenase diaphorase moiety large subunit